MSILDKLIVILDDGDFKTVEEIKKYLPNYSKQIICASLGRLISKKIIIKNKDKYKITKEGRLLVTKNIELIKNYKNNNSTNDYTFIMFNIPEKERTNRDVLRIFLSKNGFGRVHNTLWISLGKDISELEYLIKELNIKKNILIYNVKMDNKNLNKIIQKTYWDFNYINKEYNNFIEKTKKFLFSKNKSKYNARILVYSLGKIINNDPCLPKKYLNNDYKGNEAYNYYLKLRQYCY